MTSGRQSKRRRQIRATAPPSIRGKRGPRRASPKVLATAAAVLVLLGIGIGVVAAFTGDGLSSTDASQRGSLTNAPLGATDVQQLLQRIPQHGSVLGSPSAPVTMVEYVDLQCPYCQQFITAVIPDLVQRYVRTGKLKIEARPIAFIGPDSERGRSAVLAAGRQNRLFNLMDLLYYNQGGENAGWLSEGAVQSAAASIPGLDVPALLAAQESSAVAQEAERIETLAQSDDVRGTPTILVGKSGGPFQQVQLTSAGDPQPVRAAVESALP